MTTSFGSICFGSLLVAILQALRSLADQAQQSDDMAIFACIAECILACLASIVEYFNKVRLLVLLLPLHCRFQKPCYILTVTSFLSQWAFVYVGIYGMPYCKAGKSVFELFRNRGWEAVSCFEIDLSFCYDSVAAR
jgi:ABC-type arginine/histidine transport system permease subunit